VYCAVACINGSSFLLLNSIPLWLIHLPIEEDGVVSSLG
jgi:hypothetical protein